MTQVTCAISGLEFTTSYLDGISIPHNVGYYHPVFALNQKQLYYLYSKHTRLELKSVDSYLLFLAFLHSTGQIDWQYPCSRNPNCSATARLIENNLTQLVAVIEKTSCIRWQGFTQPSFKVTYDNSMLDQIPNWIEAWENNLESFGAKRADIRTLEALQKVENKLSHLILSGEKVENISTIIADWADRAAEFPADKREEWKRTIRSCFNTTKMFATPLAELKEVKEYCECNIEAGSIHFHALYKVLKEGISRHVNYLGGSTLALGYTLIPVDSSKNDSALEALAAKAGSAEPTESDFGGDRLAFIKAKLAYKAAGRVAGFKAEREIEAARAEAEKPDIILNGGKEL